MDRKYIPFICSRTKFQDFVSEYLVYPSDLEWKQAKKYVASAMDEIKYLCDNKRDVRYAVFKIEDYCVFGIGCTTKFLVEKLNYAIDVEYLKDKFGRQLQCFIGFAVKCSHSSSNSIPDIMNDEFLERCCEVYFKHLKKHWTKENVTSEKIAFDGTSSTDGENSFVELREKSFISSKPEADASFNDISVTRKNDSFLADYSLNSIINKDIDESYISYVNNESMWQRLEYKNAHVTDELYASLPGIAQRLERKNVDKMLPIISEFVSRMQEFINKISAFEEQILGCHSLRDKIGTINIDRIPEAQFKKFEDELLNIETAFKSFEFDESIETFLHEYEAKKNRIKNSGYQGEIDKALEPLKNAKVKYAEIEPKIEALKREKDVLNSQLIRAKRENELRRDELKTLNDFQNKINSCKTIEEFEQLRANVNGVSVKYCIKEKNSILEAINKAIEDLEKSKAHQSYLAGYPQQSQRSGYPSGYSPQQSQTQGSTSGSFPFEEFGKILNYFEKTSINGLKVAFNNYFISNQIEPITYKLNFVPYFAYEIEYSQRRFFEFISDVVVCKFGKVALVKEYQGSLYFCIKK